MLQYPLTLNFKLIALAPRIRVTDATGREILYVHQKTFKLKEDVRIYSDESKSTELYRINADRIFDFSAKYNISESAAGRKLGAIKHRGMRSIWSATYEMYDANEVVTHILTEDNPWVKVLDTIASNIDIIGMFSGYFLNPTYTVHRGTDKEGEGVLRLSKKPAFFESNFIIENLDPNLTEQDERRLILGIIMAVQMERSRG